MPDKKVKKLGGDEGGVAMEGTVAEINMSDLDNDKKVDVTVRHGPKPKKDKDGFMKGFPETTRLRLPSAEAEKLKLGDKVEILVRHKIAGGQVRV